MYAHVSVVEILQLFWKLLLSITVVNIKFKKTPYNLRTDNTNNNFNIYIYLIFFDIYNSETFFRWQVYFHYWWWILKIVAWASYLLFKETEWSTNQPSDLPKILCYDLLSYKL